VSAKIQDWSADRYAANARFVADLGNEVLALLAPQAGERILDLGCGDGALTAKLAATGAHVVGVDGSPDMVRAARARGLDAHVADGQALAFDGEFDAVFTNAALHWMPDGAAVIDGVFRALKPGGRFVGEFGGHGNVAAIVTALSAVLGARGLDASKLRRWYPTAERYAAMLEAGGFTVQRAWLIPRPTPLPTGMRGWLSTFADPFLADLPRVGGGPGNTGLSDQDRAALMEEVVALLAPALQTDTGEWIADYVRLRFWADKPGATKPTL
jgi:SAM-dependent methyltransferase